MLSVIQSNCERFSNLVDALFTNDIRPMRCGGSLRKLAYSLMAVQLMHFERFHARHGPRHSAVVKMTFTVREYGFTRDDLFLWGEKIRDHWILQTKGAYQAVQDKDDQVQMNTSAVSGLSTIMMGMLKQMEAQEEEKQELTKVLKKIKRRLDDIEGKCCVIVDEEAGRPSKKQKTSKKDLEDDDDNSTVVEVEEITDAPAPKTQPKKNVFSIMSQAKVANSTTKLDEVFGENVHDHTWATVIKNLIVLNVRLNERGISMGSKVSKQKKNKIKETYKVFMTHFISDRLKNLMAEYPPSSASPEYASWVGKVTDASLSCAKQMFDFYFDTKLEDRKKKKLNYNYMHRNYRCGAMCGLVLEMKHLKPY